MLHLHPDGRLRASGFVLAAVRQESTADALAFVDGVLGTEERFYIVAHGLGMGLAWHVSSVTRENRGHVVTHVEPVALLRRRALTAAT